jgi:hypothetical protein
MLCMGFGDQRFLAAVAAARAFTADVLMLQKEANRHEQQHLWKCVGIEQMDGYCEVAEIDLA